ncbi:protein arginine N-methyltransferase 7 isoform X2 [Leptopilina heterotoma]|uniref:protein arginine N-methyltransferase 7 isoform X2 n=1 Tax=Leptopilina heterotoma TaxID=63436 RepID=UPI001CA7E6BF|nr:protein arginine N-methyltransferase 7 isoform X2 [Leptopilina heterotoma]
MNIYSKINNIVNLQPKKFLPFMKMSVFTQWLNPLIGILTWEEKHSDYDYHQEIARSAFADMLHDEERNKKYYSALKSAIDKKHKNGEEANVLDIGTGTGLLSMMAAKCGADSVIACETFKPMALCAEKIIKANGFDNIIKLIHKPSTALTVGKDGDIQKRPNILVAEVFDTELIGEGALSTFHHASHVLLEENSIVIPSKGTVWIQVIESELVKNWNKLNTIRDNDGRILFETNYSLNKCYGSAVVQDLQLSRISLESFKPLLPPQKIFHFDWSGKVPLQFDEKTSVPVKPIANGKAHAVFMWWDIQMDTEGENILSCAPVWEHPFVKSDVEKGIDQDLLTRKIPWRDHWMQAIYHLPAETPIQMNHEVSLIGCHDEYSFWFNLKNDLEVNPEDFEIPSCNCCLHLAYTRNRISQLNDSCRNGKYIEMLRRKINSSTTCLCISEGSLLGIIAAKFGAKKVIVFEPTAISRRAMETFVEANNLTDQIEIISSLNDFPTDRKIDFIIGEPFFLTSILPWDNLRFWYIGSKHFPNVPKFPVQATIHAVPMEFIDLQKIRTSIGDCEGFNLSIFDELVQDSSEKSDSPVEAQPLWEYFGNALSSPFEVANFDLAENVLEKNQESLTGNIKFEVDGSCNGIALWIDWKLDNDIIISSGPQEIIKPGEPIIWDQHIKQGVHLLKNTKIVKSKDTLSWSFDFKPKEGFMKFEFHVNETS